MLRCPFLILLAASSGCLQAQVAMPPPLWFDGPEVIKLDWNTSSPRAGDFNGDGLMDLAVLNADRARIEFLLQRKGGPKAGAPERTSRTDRWNPILELSRLDKQPLVIGRSAWSLTTGDWNGDGKTDIAYTTDDEKLVLRMQGKGGDWSQKKEFSLDSTAEDALVLQAADLNADGKDDIALLTATRLMIWLQKGPNVWAEAQTYVLGELECGGLEVQDLNSDGRPDLFYTAPGADALMVRLQQADGGFGEEWRIEIPTSRSWLKALRLREQMGFAWIDDDTGMVEIARLKMGVPAPETEQASSIRHAMPAADSKIGATAFGDLNGDGLADVILADPKGARLWFYAGQKDGTFEGGREFPSLSGVEGLVVADVDADGHSELLLLSPAEKSIGLARWQQNRLAYPEVIHQTADTLLALQAGPVGASQKMSVVALTEVKSKVTLLKLSWVEEEKKFEPSTLELPSAPTRPNALRLLDVNHDGRGDVVLFSSLASMQILLSQEDEKTPFKRAEGLPDNLINKLSPLSFTTGDVDGDGKDEIIVAKDQLARAFRIGTDGKAATVEQFNAPAAGDQISAVFVKPRKQGKPGLLLADTNAGALHEMATDNDGVYRQVRRSSIPAFTPETCHLIPMSQGDGLLLIGKSRFSISPLTGNALHLENVATVDTELKDTAATDLLTASFSGSSTDDLLLIDAGKSRVLEFLQPTGGKEWKSGLYFRVFDIDPQYRGKTGLSNEPHDYAAADLNGDGKPDLVLLVHDRLLLYTSKPQPASP